MINGTESNINQENTNESLENTIVKKVLEELKERKLLKTRSSYKSTEKILFCLNALPEAIKLIDEEVKELEKESKKITKPTSKSNKLVLNEKEGKYIYRDEVLETRISDLKQISIKAKSQIRLVKKALRKIENEKYYAIIPNYYFNNKKIPVIAEENNWSVGSVSENKKKLINKLKILIFPDTFLDEL